MDVKSLNNALRDEAITMGLCAGWQRMWKKGWDRTELIQKYKEGIDFCIQHDYPKNDFIKKNFTRDLLRENGILVDDERSLLNKRMCVLQGASEAIVRYNAWNVGTVYIRHNSHAIVTAKNMAFVIVRLFDNAEVECSTQDKASIVVLRHNEKTKVLKHEGNVKITDEFDYLK